MWLTIAHQRGRFHTSHTPTFPPWGEVGGGGGGGWSWSPGSHWPIGLICLHPLAYRSFPVHCIPAPARQARSASTPWVHTRGNTRREFIDVPPRSPVCAEKEMPGRPISTLLPYPRWKINTLFIACGYRGCRVVFVVWSCFMCRFYVFLTRIVDLSLHADEIYFQNWLLNCLTWMDAQVLLHVKPTNQV